MPPFRFKQFTLSHDRSSMRVGTDAVSLGAWARCGGRVLDVGCGCGIVGLMAAQRGAQAVTLLDLDAPSVAEARENAAESPWGARIEAVEGDFLSFTAAEPFDNILSNPPFFATGLRAPDARRAAARHGDTLPPEEFMARAAGLLAPGGAVSVILPPDQEGTWTLAAGLARLAMDEAVELLTRPGAPARRVMVRFCRGGRGERRQLPLDSEEYKQLTNPFYL